MKKARISLAPLFILILSITILASCGKSTEELIVGTWSGTDFDFEQTEGPDLAAMIDGGKDLHIRGNLILEETGTYIISSPDNVINGKGIWKVKGDQLIMTDENKNEVIYDIVDVSDQTLITFNEVAMETPLGNLAGKITLTYKRQE